MALTAGAVNYIFTLITLFTSPSKVPTENQALVGTFGAILTAQFIDNSQTQYKNNPEILAQRMEFDFIVVGSGSGGSVIAGRLTEAEGLTTLLLEAGCYIPILTSEVPFMFTTLLRSPLDWHYRSRDFTVCLEMDGGCWVPRGRMLCGCPGLNLQYAVRGDGCAYDEWETVHKCTGWNYKEMLRYFKKSEGNTNSTLDPYYHNTKGPLKISHYYPSPQSIIILNGAKEMGFPIIYDINVPHGPCICPVQGTLFEGRRYAVCKAYVNKSQYRRNFKILRCAIVTRILFEGNRAIGVEFYYNGVPYQAFARREVVLCAGSIGTPLLLQLSGVGMKQDLIDSGLIRLGVKHWLELPVGRCLWDHLAVWLWFSFCGTFQSFLQLIISIGGYYSPPNRFGDFAGMGTLPCIGFFNIPISNGKAIIECYFFMFEAGSVYLESVLALTKYRVATQNHIRNLNKSKMVLLAVSSLLSPKSNGYLMPNGAIGPKAYIDPIIFFNYLGDPEGFDRLALDQSMLLLLSFVNAPTWVKACAAFIKLPIPECDVYEFLSPQYRRCYLSYMGASVYHPVGTARMGPDPQTSVIDTECRIHGIQNCSIADSSGFPYIPAGNTNLPTVAFAEKCADIIKARQNIPVEPLPPL